MTMDRKFHHGDWISPKKKDSVYPLHWPGISGSRNSDKPTGNLSVAEKTHHQIRDGEWG